MIGTIVIHWNGGWCPGCERSYPEGTRACRCTDPNAPDGLTAEDIDRAEGRGRFATSTQPTHPTDAP